MKTWILAALLASPSLAQAALDPLSVALHVPESAARQRYADLTGNGCLVLDAGRPLGDQDAAGLQKLVADLDVHAGPGLQPEYEPAGSLLYTYNLIPELRGTRLVYRGLLSSTRGNSVKVSARGPASLADIVERDLGFGGDVKFIFTRQCD
jgi:hypothetical protein